MANAPKRFSPEWWQNREVSLEWCERFSKEFLDKDPDLKSNPKAIESIGAIFYNTPKGVIIPVGVTYLRDNNFVFQYHSSYLKNDKFPPISDTLPKREEPFMQRGAILPFFDNLPSEGWFGKAQGAALGDESCLRAVNPNSFHMDNEPLDKRYHRFMMFGRDYPGAVWGTYMRVDPHVAAEHYQETIAAALRSRSSISGMQPKLLGVMDEGKLRPANFWETSSHIVKLRPVNGDDGHSEAPMLLQYEYMATVAERALLPGDACVKADLTKLHLRDGSTRDVLAIERFDRTANGGKIHFEEFNQLLGKQNKHRYRNSGNTEAGAYADIADAIRAKAGQEGVKQFYARLLAQFTVSNFDNHFKNFAMMREGNSDNWKLTPDYDLAPSIQVTEGKKSTALKLTRNRNSKYGSASDGPATDDVDLKMLVTMGQEFGLQLGEIRTVMREVTGNISKAKEAIIYDPHRELDYFAPMTADTRRWHIKHGRSGDTPHEQKTCRVDFCERIDGRAEQLFAGMEKYISIQEKKQAAARGR